MNLIKFFFGKKKKLCTMEGYMQDTISQITDTISEDTPID